MNPTIPTPDRGGLRRFGFQFAVMLPLMFGLVLPWLFNLAYPRWPWIAGLAILMWALVAPGTMGLFYRSWMALGLMIGKVTSPLVMGMVYLLLFAPVAGLLKLFGKDLLHRSIDSDAASYRVTPADTEVESQFENPY